MFIKKLRKQHLLSQEHLAEITGLSLRTIQRVEYGHRVSYSSLRKLSAAFDIDVDILEREIYAMNDKSDDFNETPLWIRLVLGKGWFFGSKDRYEKMTTFFISLGIVFFIAWIGSSFWLPVNPLQGLMNGIFLSGSVAFFLAACFSMWCIRIGNKNRAWQIVETSQSNTYSGPIIATFFGLMVAVNAFSALDSAIGPFGETELEKNPPWQLLGINENDPAFKDYLAQTTVDIFATDGGRKLIRLYEKGLRLGVNTEGDVDHIRLNSRYEGTPEASFPLSLQRDMTRGDIERLIGEPSLVSDLRFGNLRVQYLIDGNKLDIDSESVILEILYRARSMSLTDMNATLASIVIIQDET
jgi:transcriptional regulator with XRE-family HTH domain